MPTKHRIVTFNTYSLKSVTWPHAAGSRISLDKGDRVRVFLSPCVAVSSVPVPFCSAINTKVRFSSIIIGDLPLVLSLGLTK